MASVSFTVIDLTHVKFGKETLMFRAFAAINKSPVTSETVDSILSKNLLLLMLMVFKVSTLNPPKPVSEVSDIMTELIVLIPVSKFTKVRIGSTCHFIVSTLSNLGNDKDVKEFNVFNSKTLPMDVNDVASIRIKLLMFLTVKSPFISLIDPK